jgi:hypothetical protein
MLAPPVDPDARAGGEFVVERGVGEVGLQERRA